jgi:hypothetical protein
MIDKLRQYVIPNLPYVVIAIVLAHFGAELAWLPYHPALVGLVLAILLRVYVYTRTKNAKKFRRDREYGSARWRVES